MTANLGYAALQVIPSMKGFEGRVSREANPALSRAGSSGGERFGSGFATKASSSIHNKFRESAKYIIGPLVGAFAVAKIGDFIGDSIRGAIEDQGAANRAKLIFGDLSERVGKFSEKAATSYGLADNEARSAAAGFGILFKQTDLSRKAGAEASIQMVKLGADLAAFGHTDPAQAFQALQKGLQGATRGLKPYGVLIDSTQQKAEALNLGILKPVKDQAKIHAYQVTVLKDQAAYNDAVAKSGKGSLDAMSAQAKLGSAQEALRKSVEGTVPPLTAQQKILANQSLILKQTTTQQGQFGRSSGDLLEQQRKLAASVDNVKDRIGAGLLPIVNDAVTFLNHEAVPALNEFSHWFEKDGARGLQRFTEKAEPFADSLLPAIGTGFKDVAGFLKDIAPLAKGTIDAFNSLPDWAQKSIVLGTGAGILAKKTGLLGAAKTALTGGSKGGGGLVGSVISKARPVPVLVTNPGFGAGPGDILGGPTSHRGVGKLDNIGKTLPVFGAQGALVGVIAFEGAKGDKLGVDNVKRAARSSFGFTGSVGGDGPRTATSHPFVAGNGLSVAQFNALHKQASDADVLRGALGRVSQGFELMNQSGIRTFSTLEPKTKRYGDFLERIPKQVTTQIRLDDAHFKRQVDEARAYAGRHISAELGIELGTRAPSRAALDGVRRP